MTECDRHNWSYGGHSGIDLCMDCPAARFGDVIKPNHQSGPHYGYETKHIEQWRVRNR